MNRSKHSFSVGTLAALTLLTTPAMLSRVHAAAHDDPTFAMGALACKNPLTANPARTAIEQTFEKLVAAHGLYNIPSGKILEPLPKIAHTEDLTHDLAAFAAGYFGVDAGGIQLQSPSVLARGLSQVYFVLHKGKRLGVVKAFIGKETELLREVLSLALLRNAQLPAFHAVEAYAIGKIEFEGKPESVLLMEAAQGQELEIQRRNIADKPTTHPEWVALNEAVATTAKGLAQLHAKFKPSLENSPQNIQRYVAHELKMLGRIATLMEPLVAEGFLTQAQWEKVSADLIAVGKKFEQDPKEYTVVHGDAHLGNFVAAPGKPTVQLIDTEKLYYSVAEPSDAMTDVGRLLASLEFAMKRLPTSEDKVLALQGKALTAYLAEREKLSPGAGDIPVATLRFHMIRYYGVLLSNKNLEPENKKAVLEKLLLFLSA